MFKNVYAEPPKMTKNDPKTPKMAFDRAKNIARVRGNVKKSRKERSMPIQTPPPPKKNNHPGYFRRAHLLHTFIGTSNFWHKILTQNKVFVGRKRPCSFTTLHILRSIWHLLPTQPSTLADVHLTCTVTCNHSFSDSVRHRSLLTLPAAAAPPASSPCSARHRSFWRQHCISCWWFFFDFFVIFDATMLFTPSHPPPTTMCQYQVLVTSMRRRKIVVKIVLIFRPFFTFAQRLFPSDSRQFCWLGAIMLKLKKKGV